MNRQTYHAKNDEVTREWVLVDAADQVFGRLAVRIARILQGKNKPQYTPHHDVGDFVVVTNVEKMLFTGRKLDQKLYQNYSGYPGGLKTETYRNVMDRHPDRLLERAVKRMMPRNRLGRQQLSKLKIYSGADHPHHAQQPKVQELAARSA